MAHPVRHRRYHQSVLHTKKATNGYDHFIRGNLPGTSGGAPFSYSASKEKDQSPAHGVSKKGFKFAIKISNDHQGLDSRQRIDTFCLLELQIAVGQVGITPHRFAFTRHCDRIGVVVPKIESGNSARHPDSWHMQAGWYTCDSVPANKSFSACVKSLSRTHQRL